MMSLFGGSPKDYEQFVTKNNDLKVDDLSQLYITMNDSVKISSQARQKIS